jgi:hypothetical protein
LTSTYIALTTAATHRSTTAAEILDEARTGETPSPVSLRADGDRLIVTVSLEQP